MLLKNLLSIFFLCFRPFVGELHNYSVTCVVSTVVSIPAFQAGGPGSIPGQRNYRAISLAVMIPRCQRGGPGSTPGWRIFIFQKVRFIFFI